MGARGTRIGLGTAVVAALVAASCGQRSQDQQPGTCAPASASAAPLAGPPTPDVYCGRIEQQWEQLAGWCTPEQRGYPDFADAESAIKRAVEYCRTTLGPSYARGRIAFEDVSDDHLTGTGKYGWATLGEMTTLRWNGGLEVAGLVSKHGACTHGYECRSGVCDPQTKQCKNPLKEGEACIGFATTPFDPSPCREDLFCDADPPSPALAGYPPSTPPFARSPIAAGKVEIEAIGTASEHFAKRVPRNVLVATRCFEFALAADKSIEGAVELEAAPAGEPAKIVKTTVPAELSSCAAARIELALHETARVRFGKSPGAAVVRPRTGQCRRAGVTDDPCGRKTDCAWGLECVNWKCTMEDIVGPTCSSDFECSFGACDLGICRGKQGPGGRCTTSHDCLAGVCQAGTCLPMCATNFQPRFDPD